MSRLVGPVPYGIVAPAMAIGALGKQIAESGLSYFTVTTPSLKVSEARDLYRQSLRLCLVMAILAAAVAAFWGPPKQMAVRSCLTFCLVLFSGATGVPIAWAQRHGHLGKLEWWGAGAQAFITFGIAVPLAYFHFGLVAVSANLIVPVFAALAVSWHFSKLSRVHPEAIRVPTTYRVGSLSNNIGSYLASNVDLLVLATYMSQDKLGVYSRASTLASIPGVIVSAAVARVGLVSLSKSEAWSDHRRFLWKSTLLTLGAFFGMAAVAGFGFDITAFAFGRKFSTPPIGFAVLTLSQVFIYGGSLLDTYLTVRRKMGYLGISHGAQAALSCAGFLVFRPQQIFMIGWILLIPAAMRYVLALIVVFQERHKPLPPLLPEREKRVNIS